MEKIYVKDYEIVDDEVFDGDLETVISNLRDKVNELQLKNCKNFIFEWHSDYDYQCVKVNFERPETDKEFKEREKKLSLKLRKGEKDLEKRRKLFEELKKEFE